MFLNTHRLDGLFKKESHYAWAAFILTFVVVLLMVYIYPHELAESSNSVVFVNAVARFVPIVRNFIQHIPPYTPYWGVFYSVFWTLVPIHIALGYTGTFFLSEYRYQRLIIEMTDPKFFMVSIFLLGLCSILFTFPIINVYSILGSGDKITVMALIYLSMLSAGSYTFGRIIGAFQIRYKLSLKKEI